MNRITIVLACLAVTGGALAANFTDPTRVNLLERWNPDGTYGLGFTMVRQGVDGYDGNVIWTDGGDGRPEGLFDYSAYGNGFRMNHGPAGDNRLIKLTYTFPAPVTINKLSCYWRSPDHASNNYTWRDDLGNILVRDDFGGTRLGGVYVDTLATPVTTTSVTFETYLDGMAGGSPDWYHVAEMAGLGAYMAPGGTLKMDGTYNLFWEQDSKAIQTGFAAGANGGTWIDHILGSNGSKPSNTPGSSTWQLSEAYTIKGLMITHYDTPRFLATPKLEISNTGVDGSWTTIWQDADGQYYWRESGISYLPLNAPYNTSFPKGTYVRLSWGANTNEVDITEFQLFGAPAAIPGDANSDGKVDFADYLVLESTFGGPPLAPNDADFNDDNVVDFADYLLLESNFGVGTPVPEPMTLSLLALGGLALIRRR